MATLNFSGKNSFSKAEPWQALETGTNSWEEFDSPARDKIVRHYAPKVRIIALRLKSKLPQQVDLDELLSAGTLGLIECLGKFKPELNIKFATYAENRIKGAMLDELRRMDWFSRSLRQRVRTLEKAMREIEGKTGKSASRSEIEAVTGLSADEVETGLSALHNQLCLSLDAIQEELASDYSTQHANEPYRQIALQDVIGKIATLIEELTLREKLVLSLYYNEELTMRETAEVMDITEGRVSQLHSQALAKLRQKFRATYGLEN